MSNALPDFGLVGRIEKKTLKNKNHKKSRNRRPWYPRMTLKVNNHIFGLTKHTINCKKCSCFSLCFYYAHFSDYKNLFHVKNGLTTSLLFFFLKMLKIWVGRTTLDGEKKRMVLLHVHMYRNFHYSVNSGSKLQKKKNRQPKKLLNITKCPQ